MSLIPSRRLIGVALGLFGLGIAGSVWPSFATLWWFAAGLIAAVCLWDAVSVLREPKFVSCRTLPGRLPVGRASNVVLSLTGGPKRRVTLRCFDHFPDTFDVADLPIVIDALSGQSQRLTYRAEPRERGEQHFGRCQFQARSALGFWWASYFSGEPEVARVYPNFAPVIGHMRLGTDYRRTLGIRPRRRRGLGSEFQELRDYRSGDSLRQIDWRATARARKPISREYQEERDQRVIFLLDCGRRMRAQDAGVTHFDAALNAVVLLSYIALRQGDSVGFAALASESRWLAPVKGAAMIDRILNNLYDLEPTLRMPDYRQAATDLLQRVHKHALVIMVTNLRTEDHDDLLPAVEMLQKRHRVVVASLRESALEKTLEQPPSRFGEALVAAATKNYFAERARGLARLRSRGVLSVDTTTAELSPVLANLYLDLKASTAM